MSGYTIKNLFDIEDTSGEHAPHLDARFGRRQIDSVHLGVSYFRFAPGFHLVTGHRHREQEEVYVVVGGSGRVKLDEEIRELQRWDVVRVAPTVFRGFEGGPDGLELIAVGSDRPEGGDGIHAADWWPATP